MKILLIVFLVLLLAGLPCSSFADGDRFTVFRVEIETTFDHEKEIEPAKDFYINGGTDAGLSESTVLDIYRKKSLPNPTTGADYEVAIKVGQVKVIKLYKDVAVTRITDLTSVDDTPVLRYRTIMVGDYAVVAKAPIESSKEDRAPQTNPMKPVMHEEPLPLASGMSLPAEILFNVDDWKLKPGAHATLASVYNAFKIAKDKDILIEGYTCSLGEAQYNMDLSEKRAQSVSDYLINSFGIPASRIQTKYHGEESPIASNETKAGRILNRRVTIRFLPHEAASL